MAERTLASLRQRAALLQKQEGSAAGDGGDAASGAAAPLAAPVEETAPVEDTAPVEETVTCPEPTPAPRPVATPNRCDVTLPRRVITSDAQPTDIFADGEYAAPPEADDEGLEPSSSMADDQADGDDNDADLLICEIDCVSGLES